MRVQLDRERGDGNFKDSDVGYLARAEVFYTGEIEKQRRIAEVRVGRMEQ